MTSPVCVIIPAFNAAETIGDTIRSVLAEPEVGHVVVIDDASHDQTVAAAANADDGTGRLTIHRQPANAGPSSARNRAIAESVLPLLAIVDADDLVMPGRFTRLLATARGNWDFVADNIVFVTPESIAQASSPTGFSPAPPQARRVGLEQFVLGNISHPQRPRAELGFLKPVFRREFIEAHDLSYDPALRLGEDFILYARALLRGARFVVSSDCGYIAVQRSRSLSGSHRTSDLEALLGAACRLRSEAGEAGMSGGMLAILDRHRRSITDKVEVRRLLDDSRQRGRWRAVAAALPNPHQLSRTAHTLRDDRKSKANEPLESYRLLLDPDFFAV